MDSQKQAPFSLSELALDALRELANIGCGHAATALAKLVGGRKVTIDVPRAELLPIDAVSRLVGGERDSVAAVQLDVLGAIKGQLLLVTGEADARALAGLLLGRVPDPGPLGADARSAICETGNIVGSACLGAIGNAFGLKLLPSIPTLAIEPAIEALTHTMKPLPGNRALVLQTRFSMDGKGELSGHFLILPELPSLPALLGALGIPQPA